MKGRWDVEAELALRAVATAAEEICGVVGVRGVTTKGSHRDVVTESDLLVEALVARVLEGSAHPILAEEASSRGGLEWLETARILWVVDPIDGTANFVAGLPYWGISVGLCTVVEGRDRFPVGAVALPALQELYFTAGDDGAFLNGRRLEVRPAEIESSLVAAGFSGIVRDRRRRDEEYRLFRRLNEMGRGCLRLGSAAANLCATAAGRLQACYGVDAQLWDVAAGLALAERAGCRILYHREPGGTLVDYVAGTPGVAEQVAEMATQHGLLGTARLY